MRGSAAAWVARRLPLADDEHREELAGSVASLVAERPLCERAREAASLIGLWLRLWGRREGLDDARQAVRQGIYLGGVLLALVVSAGAWGDVELDRLGVTGSVALVAAAMSSGAAILAAGGWRTAALAAAMGSIVAATVSSGTAPAAGILATLALLAGDRFGARHCWRGSVSAALTAGLLAAVATHAPAEAVWGGSLVVLGVLPVALLAVGWFDPRFAVAAITVWLGVFATVDAVTPSARATAWLVVSVAVLIGGKVSWTALRRSFTV